MNIPAVLLFRANQMQRLQPSEGLRSFLPLAYPKSLPLFQGKAWPNMSTVELLDGRSEADRSLGKAIAWHGKTMVWWWWWHRRGCALVYGHLWRIYIYMYRKNIYIYIIAVYAIECQHVGLQNLYSGLTTSWRVWMAPRSPSTARRQRVFRERTGPGYG